MLSLTLMIGNLAMLELKRTNIMEVAKRAGVSAMTVTRAFNGGAPVAEKTRKQIMLAAEELGYRPNPMARALRGAKTKSIGVLFSMSGPHNSSVFLRKISLEAAKKSYVTYMADSLSDLAVICDALDDFQDRAVDGIICEIPYSFSQNKKIIEKLSLFHAKVIISEKKTEIKVNQIIRDRCKAIRDTIDCFVKNGKAKPLAIGTMNENHEKVRVFMKHLEKHGIAPLKRSFINIEKTVSFSGEDFARRLAEIYPEKIPFDAIWCSCDEGAAAVMNYLVKRGISVPDDVAVAGFNNSEMCEYLRPGLASIERFDREIAECAANMLFEEMEDKKTVLKIKNYPMKFVWRESAGKGFK